MQDNSHLNLFDHDSFINGVPHNTFDRLRREDPLCWTEGDKNTRGFWSLTRHADIMLANRNSCLLYTSPSPRDGLLSRMPSSA